MSDTATNGNGSTNGTTETKVSALSLLIKEHNEATEGGKKAVPQKTKAEAYAKFKKLLAERDEASRAYDKAVKAFTDHAPVMVRVFGDFKIEVEAPAGTFRRYFPASREKTVFYREEGKVDQEKVFKG